MNYWEENLPSFANFCLHPDPRGRPRPFLRIDLDDSAGLDEEIAGLEEIKSFMGFLLVSLFFMRLASAASLLMASTVGGKNDVGGYRKPGGGGGGDKGLNPCSDGGAGDGCDQKKSGVDTYGGREDQKAAGSGG